MGKKLRAGIILLLAGSGWATPQFELNLGQLFGGFTNNNNQQNTNNPLWQILNNTAVRIGPGGIKVEVNQNSACPPLLGDPAPLGCDKTFADDGNIPCWNDTDCPTLALVKINSAIFGSSQTTTAGTPETLAVSN